MDDMTAFERQVANEMSRIVGPARPVDDLAVLEATTTRSPTWRFQAMFSAVRFVVAAAIVALFGGFLLVGVVTQPSDEVVPAAVPTSPATTPDLLPGVDLVTEELEPGVFRVLSDGTDNDMGLGGAGVSAGTQVTAGQDGSVWVRDPQRGVGDRLFRLGRAGWQDASHLHDWWPDISVAPDGTLWALGDSATNWASGARDAQLVSLTGAAWTRHHVPEGVTLTGLETPPDGSVWTSWAIGTGQGCPGGNEGDVAAGGRLAVARLVDGGWVEERIEPALRVGDGGSLAIGSDGTALLGTTYYNSCTDGAWVGIVERGADGWAASFTSDAETDSGRPGTGPIAIGSDGTAWAYQDRSIHDDSADPIWNPRLLRRTDGDWEVLGEDESVPALIGTQTWDSNMTVSADGRLWIALDGQVALDWHRDWGKKSIAATLDGLCAGVLSYDGSTWSQHLAGACATDLSAAPNGNVWVTVVDVDPAWLAELSESDADEALRLREAASTSSPAGIYVITPEAIAATE
jgi:hypothetical protein